MLFRHDGQCVGCCVAGMDDQGLARLTRGTDVGAKPFALPIDGIPGHAVVIQAGLADRHHPRMAGQRNQFVNIGFAAFVMVGMHADRGINIRVRFCSGQHTRKVFQVHRDTQCGINLCRQHIGEQWRQSGVELGKINVAMGVDKHENRLVKCREAGRAGAGALASYMV